MDKIKKISLGIFSVMLLIAPLITFAQEPPVGTPIPKTLSGWLDVVRLIFRWIYAIILVVAIGLGLYAAVLYLTSGGDSGKVQKASKFLIYAIVGLVVAVLAFSITKIVGNLIGEGTMQNI